MTSSPHLDEGVSPDPSLSPGTVEDDEYLIRELCDSHHIDEDGNIVESAIGVKDLLSQGFSVHRRQHTPIDFVKQSVQKRCSGRLGWKENVALFKAEEVRVIRDNDERAFVIIDTAYEGHCGHASIYVAFPEKGKAYARKMRRHLLPFLQPRMSVDEAFQKSLP